MMGPFGGYPDGSQQWTNSNQPIRKSSPNWGGRADVHVSADPAMSNFDESMARRSHILGRVLSDLNNAIVPREVRMSAIMTAIEELNHDDQTRHDYELDANADKILFQKLAFALSIDKSSDEVGLICTALEFVYRGSRNRVATAFNEFGMSALPFIMMMIDGVPRRNKESIMHMQQQQQVNNVDASMPYGPLREVRSKAQKSDRSYSSHKSVDGNRSMGTIDGSKSINTDSMFSLDSFDNIVPSKGRKSSLNIRSAGTESITHGTHNTDETFKTEDMDDVRDIDDVTSNTNFSVEMKSINTDEVFSDSDFHTKNRSSRGGGGDDFSEITGFESSRPDNIRSNESVVSGTTKSMATSICDTKTIQSVATGTMSNFSGDFGLTPEEFVNSEFQNEKVNNKDDTFDVSQTDVENLLSDLLSDFNNGISDDFGQETNPMGGGGGTADFLEYEKSSSNQLGVFKMLKVLRYFSRVLSAMVPLAHHPGLLDSLLYQLEQLCSEGLLQLLQDLTTITEFGNSDNSKSIMTSARIDTIAVMVNLACAEENKIMMADHPGLLETLINVARNDPSDEAREHSAIVIMNLAYSTQNKEMMAEYDQLLSTLTMLMSDNSPYTRKYAASALFALASAVSKTALLTTYCGKEILEALRQVLLHDPSEEARVNAAEALVNMARTTSNATALKLSSHPYLLDAMAEAVTSDYSADVRAYCARGLEILASVIHHPVDCHKELIRALIKACQWTKTMSIAEALKIQASTPTNQLALVTYPGLLEALAFLATLSHSSDQYVRSCALASIERLSIHPQNRPIIARNKDIMEALTMESFRTRKYGVNENDQNSTGFLMREALKNLANAM